MKHFTGEITIAIFLFRLLAYCVFNDVFLLQTPSDIMYHIAHFTICFQRQIVNSVPTQIFLVLRCRRTTLSNFIQLDQCQEVTSLFVIHELIKLPIIFIDVSFSNSIFALTENWHENQDILKSTEELGDNQELTVCDVDWNVDVYPPEISEMELFVLKLQSSAELKGFDRGVDIFQVRGLDCRS
jgi:hypothetical protein